MELVMIAYQFNMYSKELFYKKKNLIHFLIIKNILLMVSGSVN